MKIEAERDLSYIDPLIVDFLQNNRTSGISVILLTHGRKDGWTDEQTNGCNFNTSLVEVTIKFVCLANLVPTSYVMSFNLAKIVLVLPS